MINTTNNGLSYSEMKSQNILLPQMKLSLVLNQRKIFINDYITDNSIFECIYYLYRLIDIDKISETKPPIDIYINSNGGSVSDGLTLISLIEHMKEIGYEINTINIGAAYSMGFMISICGTHRKSYRYSRYMLHDVSTYTYGKVKQIEEDINESKVLRDMLHSIIKKYTSITQDQLNKWQDSKFDKYLSANELMELKGVDEIL